MVQQLYMMHLLSKENKKIAYYTDKEHTTLWNYSANSSITLYGQYEDHTHSYNEYMLYDNKIYRQCDCGYFDKKLYIEVSENITINSLNENIKVINELGIEANEYQINYKKLSEGGTWIEYNGIPNEIGEFKVELTFNELTISNEFTITDNIKTPNTYDGILNTILLGILVLIGLLSVTNLVIKKI